MRLALIAMVMTAICLVAPAPAQRYGNTPLTDSGASGVINVNGTVQPYLMEGRGLPCIVIGLAPSYPPLFSKRLKQHIRFIYVDFVNTWGASEARAAEKASMDTLVEEIEGVRRALGLERVCVIGHSAPGLLALEYAIRHPDRTSGVIMVNAPPVNNADFVKEQHDFWDADASTERKKVLEQNMRRTPDSALEALSARDLFAARYARYGPKYFYDPSYDFYWAWAGRQFSAELILRFIGEIAADYNPWPRLSDNTVPIYVALGRYDYVVPYRAWRIAEKTPHLTSELFQRSGHFTMLEEAAQFDSHVIHWLETTQFGLAGRH
jgi:proline iminopeptidase